MSVQHGREADKSVCVPDRQAVSVSAVLTDRD